MEGDLNIPVVESSQPIDVAKYENKQYLIAKVERTTRESHYFTDPITGENKYRKDEVVEVPAVLIETESLDMISDGKGGTRTLTVKATLNLQERVNKETGKKDVVISKNPKAKLWQLMRRLNVQTLEELKGKKVTVVTQPSSDEDDDRLWLRILI